MFSILDTSVTTTIQNNLTYLVEDDVLEVTVTTGYKLYRLTNKGTQIATNLVLINKL